MAGTRIATLTLIFAVALAGIMVAMTSPAGADPDDEQRHRVEVVPGHYEWLTPVELRELDEANELAASGIVSYEDTDRDDGHEGAILESEQVWPEDEDGLWPEPVVEDGDHLRVSGPPVPPATDAIEETPVSRLISVLDAGLTVYGGVTPDSELYDVIMVPTGTSYGTVEVTVQTLTAPPGDPAEKWEDVHEVSVAAVDGAAMQVGHDVALNPEDGGTDSDLTSPLNTAGDGWYRLRISARGRDLALDPQPDPAAPTEHFLFQSWPAERTPPQTLRLSSGLGRYVQLGQGEEWSGP